MVNSTGILTSAALSVGSRKPLQYARARPHCRGVGAVALACVQILDGHLDGVSPVKGSGILNWNREDSLMAGPNDEMPWETALHKCATGAGPRDGFVIAILTVPRALLLLFHSGFDEAAAAVRLSVMSV